MLCRMWTIAAGIIVGGVGLFVLLQLFFLAEVVDEQRGSGLGCQLGCMGAVVSGVILGCVWWFFTR